MRKLGLISRHGARGAPGVLTRRSALPTGQKFHPFGDRARTSLLCCKEATLRLACTRTGLVQGLLSERLDRFAEAVLYPSFSPTVGVFLLCSAGYGLWKVRTPRASVITGIASSPCSSGWNALDRTVHVREPARPDGLPLLCDACVCAAGKCMVADAVVSHLYAGISELTDMPQAPCSPSIENCARNCQGVHCRCCHCDIPRALSLCVCMRCAVEAVSSRTNGWGVAEGACTAGVGHAGQKFKKT